MKRLPLILISLGMILAACNMPSLGGGTQSMPTPDLTLTALFAPTAEATEPPASPTLIPTSTDIPVTEAPTETPIPPTPTITATSTALPSRIGPTVYAYFLSSPPVIDGNWGDWVDRTKQYPANALVYGKSNWSGGNDLKASYILGWDYSYFYIGVKVHDDYYVQNTFGGDLYLSDGVELQLDTNLYGDFYNPVMDVDDFQMGFSPGYGSVKGEKDAFMWMPRYLAGDKADVIIGSQKEDGLYRMEIAIPWGYFNLTHPYLGMGSGFVLCVDDNDDAESSIQQTMICSDSARKLLDPTTWGEVFFVR